MPRISREEWLREEEISSLPDDDNAQAVLAEDYLDSDNESPFEVRCLYSGHVFYPERDSSLEQRAFNRLLDGNDSPLIVDWRECPICIRQAKEDDQDYSLVALTPREEMLEAVSANENIS